MQYCFLLFKYKNKKPYFRHYYMCDNMCEYFAEDYTLVVMFIYITTSGVE